MERIKQIIAVLLLIVLSINFFPTDSHDHHVEELVLCKDSETHFDEHSVSCDLCEFLLQEYVGQSEILNFNQKSYLFDSSILALALGYESTVFTPNHRGPPEHTKV